MRSARSPLRAVTALLGALFLSLAACDTPADEAWLRIVGFEDEAGATTAAVTAAVSTATTSVTALLENSSQIVGGDVGVGIAVERMRIDYSGGLPASEQPVTLYLPARTKDGVGEGKIVVPIAPESLKYWVRVNAAPPPGGLSVTARVTFSGRTDEGRELETSGGLLVTFTP